MNIYLISGLGADRSVFSKLTFSTVHTITHIEWISPARNEDLPAYVRRLSTQIDESKPFVLIGVSFGGIVAVEFSRFMKPVHTIIISSVYSSAQIPLYFKLGGVLKMHKLVPAKLLRAPTWLIFWFFGAKTGEEKHLLTRILRKTDDHFLKWAISQIISWHHRTIATNIYQVHGTSDRIFPIALINADVAVPSGSHLMVYSQSEIISEILAKKLGE